MGELRLIWLHPDTPPGVYERFSWTFKQVRDRFFVPCVVVEEGTRECTHALLVLSDYIVYAPSVGRQSYGMLKAGLKLEHSVWMAYVGFFVDRVEDHINGC